MKATEKRRYSLFFFVSCGLNFKDKRPGAFHFAIRKILFYFCQQELHAMIKINPSEVSVPELHGYLLGAIGPRPIAFASTVNAKGQANLSPFSFFNVFSANPPILIFSPARRGRDNTTKHTYENVKVVPEVVINVVTHAMVQQTSLSSTEYAEGVSEFIKAGFTPVDSETVTPFRVKESPVQMECKVLEVQELGKNGGAGNLVICEVMMLHIDEQVLNEKGAIDQRKIDLVGRMGGDWYCRANGEALFEIAKPLSSLGIGIDQIPTNIRLSTVLSGNDLGQLGNVETLPSETELETQLNPDVLELIEKFGKDTKVLEEALHRLAKELLKEKKVAEAWNVLLSINNKPD
jgi:flavin reductase (DIM6/NTAB) family NADH-FMN oxidoreductase RutF